MVARQTRPGTMAALAQRPHVISWPRSAARLTASGFAAIAVMNIALEMHDAWKHTCAPPHDGSTLRVGRAPGKDGKGGGRRAHLHHIVAHDLLGAVLRVGAAREAEGLGEGEEDAARARGDAGDRGREKALGGDEGVGEAERGLAEGAHDVVRDAVAEARLDEAAREPEGDGDEPPAGSV